MAESKMKVKKALDIFQGLKKDTVRRNSQRSAKWLVNKIKLAGDKLTKASFPKIGGMYLYVYDAKYKDKLPYWDASPLVIPVKFEKGGFAGLNFHYIPPQQRMILFRLLGGMNTGKKNQIRISYGKLLALSNTLWKFAYKRYLYSHLQSRLLEIKGDEWEDALMLPVANWQNRRSAYVYTQSKKFA